MMVCTVCVGIHRSSKVLYLDRKKDDTHADSVAPKANHCSLISSATCNMKLVAFFTAAAVAPTAVRSLATRPLRVTVFGGTGYVGSNVCERLIKRGHEVTAVSRRGLNPKPDSKELSQVCVSA